MVNRYEQVVKQIIVDREGMAGEFLASVQAAGRKVGTV
jgi:hypothetical protein